MNSLQRSVQTKSSEFKSVRNTPGHKELTQPPRNAHSTARDFVSATPPALLAEYAATSKMPTKEDNDAILMMRPYSRSIICLPNTLQARSVPLRFVSMIAFHSDSGKSSVGKRLVRPAQFTRI